MVYKKGSLLSPQHDHHLRASPPSIKPGQVPAGITTESNAEEDSDVEGTTLPQNTNKGTKRDKKRVFGLSQDKNPELTYISPDDYAKRYPPDEWGKEMGPNARVWRVYLDEAELNDRDMVEGWKDGVDVLLVFAGLFSAVVTTFVTQTSQKLDQDPGQISASMLTQLFELQWALATGLSLDDISPSKLDLSFPPQYSTSDAWVNGLWFTSLTLSLVTALYAVLIKQWVQSYVSFISGTPQERARIHHFRYMGIQRWSVPAIIGVLPVLLYAALFLFILGLVIFLQALKLEIAYTVGGIGGTAFVLYVTTNALPIFYLQCPYRTPLIEHVRFMICYTAFILCQVSFPLTHRIIPKLFLQHWAARLHHKFSHLKDRCEKALEKEPSPYDVKALRVLESKVAEDMQDEVVAEVIRWLLTSSSNPSVKPLTLESISGLRFGFSQIDSLLGGASFVQRELMTVFGDCSVEQNDIESSINSPSFYATERILRAFMFLPTIPLYHRWYMDIPVSRGPRPLHITFPEQGGALQRALATYFVRHALMCSYSGVSDIILSLFDILNTTKDCPMVWHAWFNYLQDEERIFECPDTSLAGVYSSFKPFFDTLLDWNSSPQTWTVVAPFVCKVLSPNVIEGHHDLLNPSPAAMEQEGKRLYRSRFCAVLIKGAIEECGSGSNSVAELEDVVMAAMKGLVVLDLSQEQNGQQRTATPYLAMLEELYNQPFFVNDAWSSITYKRIFEVYLGLLSFFNEQPASFPPSTAIPLQHLSGILSNERCASGLIHSIISPDGFYPDCPIHGHIQHITQYLDGLKVPSLRSEVMVKYVFASFDSLDGMPKSLAPAKDPVELTRHWSNRVQPLVRWMLEKVIAQDSVMESDEKEHPHPSIQAFSTRLVERADVFTFVCSSFLVLATGIVFSDESQILMQLAMYHKGKPGAADVWHAFLAWVVAKVSKVYVVQHKPLPHKDYRDYIRMSNLVDQLVSTLGLDGSVLRLPPLTDDKTQKSTRQEGGADTTQTKRPSVYPTSSKRSNAFQKLICWKAANTNREEIELESNERAVAEDV